MAIHRQYPNPPITEAIIDLQVRLPQSIRVADLEPIHSSIERDYPSKSNRNLARGRFEVGRQVSASVDSIPIGLMFKSQDERQIFQARTDGCTLSRLTPYHSWESFRDEARRLWTVYRNSVGPEAIHRVAVRYINRIDIPFPFDDLKEYLRTVPEVSPDLSQGLAGLFMQLTIPQADINSVVLLTEALVEPTRPQVASVILDIDLFRSEDVPADEKAMWAFFETLHDRKNLIFEACITEKSRELFA